MSARGDSQPRDRAWIDAGWWRIGGAGVSDPLWCCPVCHAATTRPDDHTTWHTDEDEAHVTRFRNLLRFRSGNVRLT